MGRDIAVPVRAAPAARSRGCSSAGGGAFRLCAATPFECSPLFFKPFSVFSSVEKAGSASAVDVCCHMSLPSLSKAFFSYLPVFFDLSGRSSV